MPRIGQIEVGEPITDFALDEDRGLLLSGSVSGRVMVYNVSGICGTATTLAKESVEMCSISDEGIRAVSIVDGVLYAVVGDLHIKKWTSLDSASVDFIKFQRHHEYIKCLNTISLMDSNNVLVISSATDSLLHVRLSSSSHSQNAIPMDIPKGAVALSYNGRYLVLSSPWTSSAQRGREIKIFSVSESSLELKLNLHCSLKVPERKQSYWGFQVSESGKYIVVVSKLSKFSVFNNNGEKVCSFDSFCKNIVGFVISESRNGELDIIALANDNTCRIWREGKLMHKIQSIDGIFSLGYPYVVKLLLKNQLFYSSDIGIHVVDLDFYQD